ncbi:deoxyribonuclease V [Salinisphaera sp.]|uniref:deoxyribonuclease V n=1 Tax=Salinisphaera sp. TaxID=1914330 RepID=UPI002D7671F3|nr:deoxyribonuclease V [Salinisphaera sp.]HET7314895.1 deoxyribonuclease V [Salinisphaera sp.]
MTSNNDTPAGTSLEPVIRHTADGRTRIEHAWPREARAGRAIQHAIARHVDTQNALPAEIRRIAGVDIGFEDSGHTTRAAIVVLDPNDLSVLEQVLVRRPTRMPYIPGLLSFREIPAALDALDELSELPDLLMVDGHGIAHPRRLGVATHLGLASGLPTIGVAKKRLTGTHDPAPEERLAWTPLMDGHEIIGAVLRSRVRVKPIFISPGHRVDLDTALDWVTRTLTRYRLPETTRAADRLASRRR